MENSTTVHPGLFFIDWFKFPSSVVEGHHDHVEMLHDVLIVISLLCNPILLWLMFRTSSAGGKNQTNTSILLGSICMINLVMQTFGLIHVLDKLIYGGDGNRLLDTKISVAVTSTFLPKYYISTFLLALNNYGMIVEPLRFQRLQPRRRTTLLITFLMWTVVNASLIPAAFLIQHFNSYVETSMTVILSLCWVITAVIAVMYARILRTLHRRKLRLQKTLNVRVSRQGFVVMKQNAKLTRVLFIYIVVMVIFTLPLYTSLILMVQLHGDYKHHTDLVLFCLHVTPLTLCVPIYHCIHWIIFTPLYYRHLKKTLRRFAIFCGILRATGELSISHDS